MSMMDVLRNRLSGSIAPCFKNLLLFGGITDHNNGRNFLVQEIASFPINSGSDTKSINNASINLNPLSPRLWAVGFDIIQTQVEFSTKSNYYSYKGSMLERMSGLDLSCNDLTGAIPSQLGDLQQIRGLNLSHNHLSGSMPNTFSNLTNIESLDLSYNNLSGEIPAQLSQLYSLAVFNLSYNHLSGTPPSTGQFANFDESSYKGNHGLCGPILKRTCDDTTESPTGPSDEGGGKDAAVDLETFYWSFAASYVTILLAFVTVLCINSHWRRAWFRFVEWYMSSCFSQY